jgi:hypothetical protein
VQHGGRVLTLGVDSLRRTATISGASATVTPAAAQPAPVDALGAHRGALVTHNTSLISVLSDGLGIFNTTALAFPGFTSFEPISSVSAPGRIMSSAGISDTSSAIVGYRLGAGIVVDIGLVGFGATLPRNVNSQELVNRLWAVLGG